jgi:hypothetical protein
MHGNLEIQRPTLISISEAALHMPVTTRAMLGLLAVCLSAHVVCMGFANVPERAESDSDDKGLNKDERENRWRRDKVYE